MTKYNFKYFVRDVQEAVLSEVPFMYCCDSKELAIHFLQCCEKLCAYSDNPVEKVVEMSHTDNYPWRIQRKNGLTITAFIRS